jgi:xanthine dehydrogenase YagT iron-sulfur-binding subunit
MGAIGEVAPELGFELLDPRLSTLAHRPRVIAFSIAWRPRDRSTLRADLRGLGAQLIVATADGVWWCRPDDPDELLRHPAAIVAAVIERARARYAIGGDDAVFVIDGGDRIRFSTTRDPASLANLEDVIALSARAAPPPLVLDRRDFAMATLAAACAVMIIGCKRRPSDDPPPPPDKAATGPAPDEIAITLRVNAKQHDLTIDPRTSLLDLLRERLGLTGTKKGCDHGQCGACTVHLDGRRIYSCLTLAAMASGSEVTTIEGLSDGDNLHPVQAAFVAHDGLQCGYCTPGQIMSAVALLAEGHATSDAQVREEMCGNLCRCGAYPNIVAAIQTARGGRR